MAICSNWQRFIKQQLICFPYFFLWCVWCECVYVVRVYVCLCDKWRALNHLQWFLYHSERFWHKGTVECVRWAGRDISSRRGHTSDCTKLQTSCWGCDGISKGKSFMYIALPCYRIYCSLEGLNLNSGIYDRTYSHCSIYLILPMLT